MTDPLLRSLNNFLGPVDDTVIIPRKNITEYRITELPPPYYPACTPTSQVPSPNALWRREGANAVGIPWAWERLERLGHGQTFGTPWVLNTGTGSRERMEKALGTPWERLGHGKPLGTPWERADVERVHCSTVFPHWERLGNGLTLNGNTLKTPRQREHLGNTSGV